MCRLFQLPVHCIRLHFVMVLDWIGISIRYQYTKSNEIRFAAQFLWVSRFTNISNLKSDSNFERTMNDERLKRVSDKRKKGI